MLGMAYQMVGQYGGAEQMFIRALETNLKIHAPDDDILTTFMNVARLYEWMHKPEAAIPWYEKALAFAEKAKGPEGTFVGLILAFTAEAYFKLEKYEKAEPLYLRAIAIYEKAPKPKYLNAVSILESYIKLLKKMNRKAEVKEAEKRLKAMRAK
jgi:tetratricopeptide (TPR) repeat protein